MKRRITKMVLLTFTLSMCAAVPSFADVEQNEFASAEANGKYLSENKIDQSYDLPTAEDEAWNDYFNSMIE